MISEVSGRSIQYQALTYQALTEAAMLQGARDQGMPEGAVQYMGVLYNAVRSGWMAVVTEDVKNVIGRAPVTFGDFVQRQADIWKS
jgi:hypothetical protein